MKKLLILSALTLTLTIPTLAQETPGKYQGQLTQLTQDLSLTPDQVAKIKEIYKAKKEAKETAKENAIEKVRKWQAQQKETDDKIKAVLTDDQKEKFDTLKEKKTAARKENMRTLMLAKITKELNLDEAQQQKAKDLIAQTQTETEAVLKQNLPAKEQRTQLKQIQDKRETEMKAMLTPAQIDKLAALKKDLKHHQKDWLKKYKEDSK